jgi:hypothetical protein
MTARPRAARHIARRNGHIGLMLATSVGRKNARGWPVTGIPSTSDTFFSLSPSPDPGRGAGELRSLEVLESV